MNSQEISELCDQYKVTGSQSESIDIPFSPGSQDSISNIHLDFDTEFNRSLLCNELDINILSEQLVVRNCTLNVSFESQTLPVTKSTAWTYSEPLNRLYVNIGQPCPIRVRLVGPCAVPGTSLRCFLRYQKSVYAGDPVTQCANHSYSEADLSLRGHVLRCRNVGVKYEKDTTLGHYSLCLPFGKSEDDVDGDTYVFEFKCLTTCLFRRAMELVFQVEWSGSIICFYSVNVRVCSCPGRDRRHDENPHLLKSKLKSEQNALSHSGLLKRHSDDNEEFTIKVKGRKNYELIIALKQRLEVADAYENHVAEDADGLASPKAKLMTSRERIPAKEQPNTHQAREVFESSDVDRSHNRWRPHLHSHQLLQSQNLVTGKIRKNKGVPVGDSCAVSRA